MKKLFNQCVLCFREENQSLHEDQNLNKSENLDKNISLECQKQSEEKQVGHPSHISELIQIKQNSEQNDLISQEQQLKVVTFNNEVIDIQISQEYLNKLSTIMEQSQGNETSQSTLFQKMTTREFNILKEQIEQQKKKERESTQLQNQKNEIHTLKQFYSQSNVSKGNNSVLNKSAKQPIKGIVEINLLWQQRQNIKILTMISLINQFNQILLKLSINLKFILSLSQFRNK